MQHQRDVRGIWRAPNLTAEGHPYLKAISTDNRVLARATVYPWDSEREVAKVLRRHLDREDPAGGGEAWKGGDHG